MSVGAIKLDILPNVRDGRGTLTVADFAATVPFPVVRLFYIRDVPPGTCRGRHAHRLCSQYMICISGKVEINVTDGKQERSLELAPGNAVLIAPGIFAAETYKDPDTILLVLCDRPYEAEDYIHSLEELRTEAP